MEQQIIIIRSPAGPLAWEVRLRETEAQCIPFRSLTILSSNLPEVRYVPCLPVPSDSEACLFARNVFLDHSQQEEICLI